MVMEFYNLKMVIDMKEILKKAYFQDLDHTKADNQGYTEANGTTESIQEKENLYGRMDITMRVSMRMG